VNKDKYTTLTGLSVSTSDEAAFNAQVRRTKSKLESMLGFTLSPNSLNLYNELGKTTSECECPDVDTSNLIEPDEVNGSYRLFKYNKADKYIFTDPFVTLYSVKLVVVRPIDGNNGITLKTFDSSDVTISVGQNGISKYIENCMSDLCGCQCASCMQIAVDADWLTDECLPEDLLYIWADMITHELDCKKNIKSESIGGHSYTKAETTSPFEDNTNLSILKKYAGPNGSLSKMPV